MAVPDEEPPMTEQIDAGVVTIAYERHGKRDGWPVVLLHGFPYDIHAYDEVAPRLAAAGADVVVPYLRGYGPTRFRSPDTPRSGQQAALAADLLALLDALELGPAVLAGYDWGGRAACIVSALWPERVRGLVSANGYNVHDIPRSGEPSTPENEYRLWYQYYFHGERGRAGLAKDRAAFCRVLWQLWSPSWRFDEATYRQTAASFDNPDFVEVVIHSYRHRYALVAGDPAYEPIEQQLAAQPPITVPSVILDGTDDGVARGGSSERHLVHFTGRREHRFVAGAGHNLPQEAPAAFADAVLTVDRWTRA
jgi:pimeloyl-ACP methyl ester carboxylesterase